MKKIILVLVLLLLAVGMYGFVFWGMGDSDAPLVESLSRDETAIGVSNQSPEASRVAFEQPSFAELELSAPHSYDKSTYAFRGSAMIDIDGNGVEELWLAGGKGESDTVLKYSSGVFENIAASTGLDWSGATSAGAVSLDVDQDGDVDLIVAREDGIYIHTNTDGFFSERQLDVTLPSDALPFSLAAGDINRDGWVDLYISTFIAFDKFQSATFNDPANRSPNLMLLNRGDNTFEDVTDQTGLAFDHNTFQATFVDLDGDRWQDLILAPNTSEVMVYRNKGDGSFEKQPSLSGNGFWMGLAVADVDNDGDQDFFVSNVGETIPERVGRGDLRADQTLDRPWRLYRNDGNFSFTDIAQDIGIVDQKFAWGAMFGDVNNDGEQDLAVAENYIKWPPHNLKKLPGSFFLQKEGEMHRQIAALDVENPFYGTTPLFADFTADGQLELIYVNLDSSARIFRNEGTVNNYLSVAIPDNVKYLGATVTVELSGGNVFVQQKIVGQGLMSDGASDLRFGLGKRGDVKSLIIETLDGDRVEIDDVAVNTRIEL